MDVVYERCCGLDVHKRTVVACLLTPGPRGQPQKAVRTFGTMTAEVLALAEWLAAAGCSHVAMEGTGVSWQPIWNLLEDRFTLLLVNAHMSRPSLVARPTSRMRNGSLTCCAMVCWPAASCQTGSSENCAK